MLAKAEKTSRDTGMGTTETVITRFEDCRSPFLESDCLASLQNPLKQQAASARLSPIRSAVIIGLGCLSGIAAGDEGPYWNAKDILRSRSARCVCDHDQAACEADASEAKYASPGAE